MVPALVSVQAVRMDGQAVEVNNFLSIFFGKPGAANPAGPLPDRRAFHGVGLVSLLGLPEADEVS
jgi:hypothetical protein